MKISDQWLRDYIETDLTPEKIGVILTDLGLEVEGIDHYESVKGSLQGIVVGKVLTCSPHPNSDHLHITTVDIAAGEPLRIVCGARNVAAGQTVAVAVLGTTLYDKEGQSFKIKKAKLRGEPSEGMICAEDEIGLSEDHGGIMILPENYEIGKPLARYVKVESDSVYEIGLTPNRADAMSHYGVARDLKAYFEYKHQDFKFHELKSNPLKAEGSNDFKIEVEDTDLIPKYFGAVIENIRVGESPEWLKKKLKAIGLGSINNVVDITNFILHAYGQPLHAFDAARIKEKKVKVGLVPKGTKFTTLDGEERTLNGTEIMIKDGRNHPMCIGGVFGGLESGVSDTTTSIFLESAYFNPVAIRKAAKAHGLNTDASFRFERGIDPNITEIALNKAIELIEEIAGGKLKGQILEGSTTNFEAFPITFRFAQLHKIAGVELNHETVKNILRALEIRIVTENEEALQIEVPPYRADVLREVDVIEDILRVYGYNNVHSDAKISFTPVHKDLEDQAALENYWARGLQANGFIEVLNNSLGELLPDSKTAVTLLNPLSNELSTMRQSLLDALLVNADYNIKRKSADLKFFEFGKIYFKNEKFEERKQLALLVTGNNHGESWLLKDSKSDFFTLKGYVQFVLQKLHLNFTEQPLTDVRFSDGLEILAKKQVIARIGVVSEGFLSRADIHQPVYYAELELETCQKLREKENFKFQDLPKFNALRRDLALLVDNSVTYNSLFQTAEGVSKYLKKISLFDVYQGKNLPEGKKSYAMSFELLSEDKTLEETEINAIMTKIATKFIKEFSAELRSN